MSNSCEYGISVATKATSLDGFPAMIEILVYDISNFNTVKEVIYYLDYEPSKKTFDTEFDLRNWEANKLDPEEVFGKLWKFLNKYTSKGSKKLQFLTHNPSFELKIIGNFLDDVGYDLDVFTDFLLPKYVNLSQIADFMNTVIIFSNIPNAIPYIGESETPASTMKAMREFHDLDEENVFRKSEAQLMIYSDLIQSMARDITLLSNRTNLTIQKKSNSGKCPDCGNNTLNLKSNPPSCWICGNGKSADENTWRDFLYKLASKKPVISAWWALGEFSGDFSSGNVTVKFESKYDFQFKEILRSDNLEILNSELLKYIGTPVKVKAVIGK